MMPRFPHLAALFALTLCATSLAADPAPLTAADIASKLSTLHQDGSSFVRLRMEIKGGSAPEVLQLQIKQRRTKASSDVLYQVLFPKERKGESVLLKKSGNRGGSGTAFAPSTGKTRTIDDLGKEMLFGSDLACEDVVDDFFSWDNQTLAGTETIDGTACQVLESKPGKGERSSYGSVKSWIDARRLVPLRIEKYSSSGKLLRRIDTTRVVTDAGHAIPANLAIRGSRGDGATQLDGSKIEHDVNYADKDFTPDVMKEVTGAR